MDKFEDIIKQKVEQFEPKFNEAHWNALDQKLTSIKKAKIVKNTILSVAATVFVALGFYFIYQSSTPNYTVKTNKHFVETNNTEEVIINEEKNSTNPIIVQEQKNEKTPVLPIEKIKLEKLETPISEKAADVSERRNEEVVNDNINKSVKTNQDKFSSEFIVSNKKVCLGDEVSFDAIDKKELLSYTWDFGDGNFSTKPNPKNVFKQQGTFVVTLLVTNKKTAEESKSIQQITVQSLPNVDFTYQEQSTQFDDNKLKYPKTIFSCKGETADTYEWNFGNSKIIKEKQPAFIFDKKGEYEVSLTAKSSNGCSNSITKTISIVNSLELYAPSAFTPNFDGNNDDFMPEALTTWDIKFEMVIKNKSGNVVYKTTDKNAAWNGSVNNQGNTLEEGMYFWQIITYDAEGKPYQHAGKINLLK
ncbi:MAG: PKD domain-containing protein [Flavobacteriales bacterium]|nr:PKD domain-containing protein [Flavobacteriales bacterium]